MGRLRSAAGLGLLLSIACGGSDGPSGPALEPRPEVQTCLPDLAEGFPQSLSDTGCFADLKSLEPGPDLIPYEVNSALWTDGAFKPRYLVVPSPERVSIDEDGAWSFPDGSVLIKVFGLELEQGKAESRRPVETRFMVRDEGAWRYATYKWNDEGTDAELLDEELTVDYEIQVGGEVVVLEYTFPGHDACTTCHGRAIDDVLGPKTSQLNRDRNYDGFVQNQITAMGLIDLLDFGEPETPEPSELARMANPHAGEGSLEERVRAYLDANCAHCHRPGGWAPSDIGLDFRYEVSLERTGLCSPMRYFEWAGIPRVVPGNPEASGLMQRFVLGDALRMPSVGSSVIDPFGTALLSDWITGLDACP